MCNHSKIIFKFKWWALVQRREVRNFRQCGVSWSVIIWGRNFSVSLGSYEEVAYYSWEKMRPETNATIKTQTVYQIIVRWDEKA